MFGLSKPRVNEYQPLHAKSEYATPNKDRYAIVKGALIRASPSDGAGHHDGTHAP
jgi:hypothetical protein